MRPLIPLLLAGSIWLGTLPLNARTLPPPGSPFAQSKVWLNAKTMRTLPTTAVDALFLRGFAGFGSRAGLLEALTQDRVSNTPISVDVIVHTQCFLEGAPYGSAPPQRALRTRIPRHWEVPLLTVQVPLAVGQTWRELQREVEQNPCIYGVSSPAVIERNGFPNDPQLSDQQQHDILESKAGWEFFYRSPFAISRETVVAVPDTGVAYDHEDLHSVIWRDASGRLPPDYADGDEDPYDIEFHGTHIAGLIGAELNNGIGVAGVAGGHSQIMAVKIFGRMTGILGDLLNGMEYAMSNGAEVINLSLGSWEPLPALKDAILRAIERGITIVVSTGNDSADLDGLAAQGQLYSPAAFAPDIEGLISVASTDSASGELSDFSNYGQRIAEIAAPGSGSVYSTFPYDWYVPGIGTSMSAPLVAGAAALVVGTLKTHGLTSDPATVERLIRKGSVSLPGLNDRVSSGAHLNLRTLAEALEAHLKAEGIR